MPAVILSVRDLAARAGDRVLFLGLDLDLRGGEVVAVRGPSGSGKTTLLRTLSLLQDPAAGTITLGDGDAATLGWSAWRRRVCLVPQLPVMLTGSVADEVRHALGYRASRDLPSRDPGRGRRLLDELRLADIADDHPPDELSVGQRQRLALVRALLLDPDVLLLDEPTSALDPDAAEALREVVRREVSSRAAAVLLVTHDSGRAMRWCDRVVDLADLAGAGRS
ncbi:ATP-binding cassette domain-containing protein [bacterium]|nr:ATP-binding cassette domain-containing protein [bacterium]